MKLGAIFPQAEIGSDPLVIRDYAQAVEEMGFNHLIMYDHVLGADPACHPGWSGYYTKEHAFHEPMVTMGYLAGCTERLELATGVMILPQRQTALVAKQAAEVAVLSGGRLRLGVGTGWNEVEYEAMGMNFHDRGKRCEEQIEVLRALWSQEVVTYAGKWHTIRGAGLNPLPPKRSIPIWLGGWADVVLRRVARMADGWYPVFLPVGEKAEALVKMHRYAEEYGRDPADIGIDGTVRQKGGRTAAELAQDAEVWQRSGATHVSVETTEAGHASVGDHIETLRQFIGDVNG